MDNDTDNLIPHVPKWFILFIITLVLFYAWVFITHASTLENFVYDGTYQQNTTSTMPYTGCWKFNGDGTIINDNSVIYAYLKDSGLNCGFTINILTDPNQNCDAFGDVIDEFIVGNVLPTSTGVLSSFTRTVSSTEKTFTNGEHYKFLFNTGLTCVNPSQGGGVVSSSQWYNQSPATGLGQPFIELSTHQYQQIGFVNYQFIYPNQDFSIPDFTHWQTSYAIQTSTPTAIREVIYTGTSSANMFKAGETGWRLETPYSSEELFFGIGFANTNVFAKTFKYGNTGTYYAQGYLYLNLNSSTPYATTQLISFTINSTSTTNTIKPVAYLEFPVACSATSTYDVWNPSDWKCIFLNTLNTMASSTSAAASAFFKPFIDMAQSIFPFSLISRIHADINAVQFTDEDKTITLNPNHEPTFLGGKSYTFISSSTTAWIIAETGFDYDGFLMNVVYVFTAIISVIIAVIII